MYDMYPWDEPGSGPSHQDENAAAWLPAPRNGAAPRSTATPRNGTAPRTSTAPSTGTAPGKDVNHANGTRRANGARHANGDAAADFTQAIQISLDRRDNGGDAVPASQPATPPAASVTRQ